jgi:hypothetical protein
MATKALTYEYVSDYCVVVFRVDGEDDWSEEQFDSAGEFDLADYVKSPEDFHLNDVYELDN